MKKFTTQKHGVYLSVVIPAYNESRRIGVTLYNVTVFLKQQLYTSEIIVVDDGSTDSLIHVVRKYVEQFPNIRIISYPENRGKGYAVKVGMTSAIGEYRLFMDADNSVTIDHVSKFLLYAESGYDIVIGSIMLPVTDRVIDNSGLHRKFLRKITKFVRSMIINIDIHDTQRGFKLFSAKAAQKLFSLQRVNRFGFDMELLFLARMLNYRIKEIAVTWINPAGSKVTTFSYAHSFMELINIRVNMLLNRYDF
ncbi:MAG: glycosyltransferase family 2 protein [bacterium]|nr:glycosyltransferase family 2 protein [bacterium]